VIDAPQDLPTPSTGIAPLMRELMAEYAATGLPPAFLPKDASLPVPNAPSPEDS